MASTPPPPAPRKRRVTLKRIALALLVIILTPVALFAFNGLVLGHGETPVLSHTAHPATAPLAGESPKVKVMAYNIAKCFVHRYGLSFNTVEAVQKRLDGIIAVVNTEQPDLLFLSETVVECGPCNVDQVASIANATGMHAVLFGENYNAGLPFYRVMGGNAILSRRPLEAVANPSLAGRQPFYITKNNRRALWGATELGGKRVLLASLHNDSFNIRNNLAQLEQILAFAGDTPAIIAGDFNARPDQAPIALMQKSGKFVGKVDGPQTFEAGKLYEVIDYIFAPKSWELLSHHTINTLASDHLPIVSEFAVKW